MSFLVTGPDTHLGKATVNRLKRDGRDHFVFEGNMLEADTLERFFLETKPSALIHCDIETGGLAYVSTYPAKIFYENSQKTLNLYEAARKTGIRTIVNPISNSTYPASESREMVEEAWWNGPLHDSVASIGMVRKASWVQSVAYRQEYGIETKNLIVGNVYGPWDYFDEVKSYVAGALITKIVTAKNNGDETVPVWGSGKPMRDFVYIEDVVDAFLKALATDTGTRPINISSGIGVSVAELARIIQNEADYRGELVFDTSKPDGAPYKVMNIDRARAVLDWRPVTDLKTGIRKTIDWYTDANLRISCESANDYE